MRTERREEDNLGRTQLEKVSRFFKRQISKGCEQMARLASDSS